MCLPMQETTLEEIYLARNIVNFINSFISFILFQAIYQKYNNSIQKYIYLKIINTIFQLNYLQDQMR